MTEEFELIGIDMQSQPRAWVIGMVRDVDCHGILKNSQWSQEAFYSTTTDDAAHLITRSIASDMRHVAQLPSPLGRIIYSDIRPNGLNIKRITVPFGVIGLIYEARPNVTFDVFSLCFKSGNVCILKGGSDADNSNRAAVDLIHQVLMEKGIDPHIVELLPPSHGATKALLEAVGHVDLCIPRGGKNLIRFVRENAKVPVIETGAGVVSLYFDKTGDLAIIELVLNPLFKGRCNISYIIPLGRLQEPCLQLFCHIIIR